MVTSTVEEYLAALPATQRAALERLRKQVLAAAPGATEKMGYGIPTFVHAGRNLVHMAAFRDHCSFFPGSGGVALALAEDLRGFTLAKGTIRFTPDRPIPAAVVRKIVKLRVAENEAAAARRARPAKKAAAKRPAAKKAAGKTVGKSPVKRAPARRAAKAAPRTSRKD